MGWFKNLISAPKTVDKALDAIVKGGDALIFTEEEKAEYNQKSSELYLKHVELTNKESSPTSIARRNIALIITIPFVFLTIGSAIWMAVATFIEENDLQKSVNDLATHWQNLAMEDYSTLVMMVAVFYFGTHVVKGLKK